MFLDRILDASIYFSFDRSGFERHQKDFVTGDLDVNLSGKRILITGANSGLGRSAAQTLASLQAEVWLLCRSEERGQQALEDIRFSTKNENVHLELVDLASQASIHAFAERFDGRSVDVLINNAGILPRKREETKDGFELTWATNVVGPFVLTELLLPNLKMVQASRIVNVSSGGMYTQRLDLEDLAWKKREFDGVVAYAQTKRAEVILTELWAESLTEDGVSVNSMHPGWADTPGVERSLPKFWKFTRDRLRSPRQGADTIVWLAACERLDKEPRVTGQFFFDRQAVNTHLLPGTRESAQDRERLWELLKEIHSIRENPD